MTDTWLDIREEDAIQYPYLSPSDILTEYSDFYQRDHNSLLISLSRYGHRVQSRQVILHDPILLNIIPTITRYCDDETTDGDFTVLMNNFPPITTKSRIVLKIENTENFQAQISRQIPDARMYEQIAFIHEIASDTFAIYLVIQSNKVIEGFFLGEKIIEQVDVVITQIQQYFLRLYSGKQFTFRHRLQIQGSFVNDYCVLAHLFVLCLHHRTKYLELSMDTIAIQKLSLLSNVVDRHDEWFGSLDVSKMSKSTHPFFETINPPSDKAKEIYDLGWATIDVLGDGNCGYYTLILGLENLGDLRYSLRTRRRAATHMSRNRPWQYYIMKLRTDLQQRSKELVETLYGQGMGNYSWNELIGIGTEDDINTLSDEFISDQCRQQEYFDGSMPNNEQLCHLQMSAYWAPHVFACLFQIRMIIYMRFSRYNGVDQFDDWSTITIDPLAPIATRFTIVYQLERMPDNEFRRMRTIEIFFTHGVTKEGPRDSHFRLLRRVLCDNSHSCIKMSQQTLGAFLHHESKVVQPKKRKQASISTAITESETENVRSTPRTNQDTEEDLPTQRKATEIIPFSQQNVDTITTTIATTSATITQTDMQQEQRASDKIVNILPDARELLSMESVVPSGTNVIPTAVTITQTNTQVERENSEQENQCPTTKTYPKLDRYRKGQVKRMRTRMFDDGLENGTLKHKTATQMLFRPATRQYFIRNVYENGSCGPRALCEDIEVYDDKLIEAAHEVPNEWMGPSFGDIGEGIAPEYLSTNVVTIRQQHTNGYCLAFSLSSALFYCGFRIASEGLAGMADRISKLNSKHAISEIRQFMQDIVPLIGRPTLFGIRTKSTSRVKRQLTWDELLHDVNPYPTVVIPVLPTGQATHAFCVVDDLIFDSTTPYALKLCDDSVKWLFREVQTEIYIALRFNQKVSPKGTKINDRYERSVNYHWDHPSRRSTK